MTYRPASLIKSTANVHMRTTGLRIDKFGPDVRVVVHFMKIMNVWDSKVCPLLTIGAHAQRGLRFVGVSVGLSTLILAV